MTLAPLPLLVAALATYRLSTAIAYEDGPWRAFDRLREWASARASARRLPWWVAEGLQCPRCLSVWIALVFVPAMAWPPSAFVLAVLAVSGAACVFSEVA